MNTISKLLFEYRKINNLTQQNLVVELLDFSNDFKALNTVTLSRWETGTTKPSLSKKRSLLNFFASKECLEEGVCHDIVKDRYENLYEPLSKVFTGNYQHIIGNLPEHKTGEYALVALNDYAYKKEHTEHVIDIEKATNATNYYTLTEDDFCDVDEPGTYYIHALYGRNPKIAALLNVKAYLHLFEHLQSTDNVLIFSTRTDGMLLTRDYGIKVVASGEDENYGFDWHGLLSPVEDILFSDTVVKLVF